MKKIIFLIMLINLFIGCDGSSGGTTTDTTSPVFTSTNTKNVNENQTSAITLSATDNNTITYSISGTDSTKFDINSSSGVVTFKTAPDYENPSDDDSDNDYVFTANASDGINNTNQNITISIKNTPENIADLYIRSAVYDNNRTTTIEDDILYLYFNAPIDTDTLNADISANFEINGTGAIGSDATVVYNQALFNQLKIYLKQKDGTTSAIFDINNTSIALSMYSIQDSSHNYPKERVETNIARYNVLARVKTGQTQTYTQYDDGNLSRGIDRNFTRDDNNNIVIDHITGIVWQDDNDAKTIKLSQAEAITYCNNLTLAGRSWRLPNIYELDSILDKSLSYPIDSAFQNIDYDMDSNTYSTYISSSIRNNSSGGSTQLYTEFALSYDSWFYNGSNGIYYNYVNDYHVRCISSLID